jgi:hypothetical protein
VRTLDGITGFTGFGGQPAPKFEQPNFTGLTLLGKTELFSCGVGTPSTCSLLARNLFSGFNNFSYNFTGSPNTFLRMTTELNALVSPSSVPEPASMIRLGAGLAGIAIYRRKSQ